MSELAPGGQLGSYEIVSALGAGGMGEVYRAHDTRLARDVALKVLPTASAADAVHRKRLLREARAAASLNHPHICTIYEVGETDGRVFIAMELIDGQSLSTRLAAGALSPAEVVRYGIELGGALAYAHSAGVAHGDFKTANVMLNASGQAKVVDFGLARQVARPSTAATTHVVTSLSDTGAIAGTLPYMAPEQFRGTPADTRTDVWSLGVVLYELAAGQRPFAADTSFALAAMVLDNAPAPLPPAVPAALRRVIERCLEKEPARRYQDAGEVMAALEMLSSAAPAVPASARSRRRPVLIAAAVLIGVALMATLASNRIRSARSAPPSSAAATAIRLAVMPFENLTGDPAQDYFSDGLTEEMIARLGGLAPQRLRVIARNSVMRYKHTGTPVDQIGRDLNVAYVLGGSARRDAARVRVTANLIQAQDQAQLWSVTYDRNITDVLALQTELAQRVAEGLAIQLLPVDRKAQAPVDREAYDLYLRGRAEILKGPDALDRAERLFTAAIRKNPTDARSYAGLADVWKWRGILQTVRGKDALAHATAAALKAVELDNSLPEAHAALAAAYSNAMGGPDPGPEFERALSLNPNDAATHLTYASHLARLGMSRLNEAEIHIDWAAAVDPLNPLIALTRGGVRLTAGRIDEAIREFRAGLAAAPSFYQFHWMLWRALHSAGRDEQALAELIALARATETSDHVAALEAGAARGGYRGAVSRLAAKREEEARVQAPLDPAYLALLYHDAGDDRRAFEWMNRAAEDGDPNLIAMPTLAPDLRQVPQFTALMRRVELPGLNDR